MRDYSKVSPQFWIGKTGKELKKRGVDAVVVALHLMTSSHANMLGMYYIPVAYIAHETGLSIEGAMKGLQCCMEVGFCGYDEEAEVVWVYEMARHQIAESLKKEDKRSVGVQNEYNDQPDSEHLRGFYEKYSVAFNMTKCRGLEAPKKPLSSQEQEQEQEQEQKQEQEQEQDNTVQRQNNSGCPESVAPVSDQEKSRGVIRAVDLSIAFNKESVRCQSGDPRLTTMAEQGITPELVKAACDEAKQSCGGGVVNLGYVVAIIARWSEEAKKLKVKGAKQKNGTARHVGFDAANYREGVKADGSF